MKTIKELEAETDNGPFEEGYKLALKDFLKLIKEEFGELIQADQLISKIQGE